MDAPAPTLASSVCSAKTDFPRAGNGGATACTRGLPNWTTVIAWNGVDALVDRFRFWIQFNSSKLLSQAEVEYASNLLKVFSPTPIRLHSADETGFAVFNILEDVRIEAFLPRVQELADRLFPAGVVAQTSPNFVHRAFTYPNDPYSSDWPYANIRARAAWELEAGNNSGVTVGIIDTGLALMSEDGQHPDLDPRRFHLGRNYVQSGAPIDDNLHGTMVTGIIAAERHNGEGIPGMTSGTEVHVCKTLRADAHGVESDFRDAVKEIVDRAAANGNKVILNYSAGGRNKSALLESACRYAAKKGMLLVAAAGESDGCLQYPAAYSSQIPQVLSVGGIDEENQPYGPKDADVFAPAVSVRSTKPCTISSGSYYGRDTGTSLAAAFVTGVAALVWSRHPELSALQLKQRILSTCRVVSRCRIIDAASAVTQ